MANPPPGPSTPSGVKSVRKARAERTDASQLPAPIECTAEELAPQLKEIGRALRQPVRQERSWEERVLAMRKLHALLLGGIARHAGFCRLANAELVPPLAMQLDDNRSKCVRLACTLIGECARVLGPGFSEGGSTLLPPLLKLLRGASPLVVVESAEAGVRAMLLHTRAAGLLPPLICGATQRGAAPALRAACVRFLGEALACYDDDGLSHHLSQIGDALGAGTADASPAVRGAACAAFLNAFERRFASHATRVRSRLSPASERMLSARAAGGGSPATTPEGGGSEGRGCSTGGSTGTPPTYYNIDSSPSPACSTSPAQSSGGAPASDSGSRNSGLNELMGADGPVGDGRARKRPGLSIRDKVQRARAARDAALSLDQAQEERRAAVASCSFEVQVFAPARLPAEPAAEVGPRGQESTVEGQAEHAGAAQAGEQASGRAGEAGERAPAADARAEAGIEWSAGPESAAESESNVAPASAAAASLADCVAPIARALASSRARSPLLASPPAAQPPAAQSPLPLSSPAQPPAAQPAHSSRSPPRLVSGIGGAPLHTAQVHTATLHIATVHTAPIHTAPAHPHRRSPRPGSPLAPACASSAPTCDRSQLASVSTQDEARGREPSSHTSLQPSAPGRGCACPAIFAADAASCAHPPSTAPASHAAAPLTAAASHVASPLHVATGSASNDCAPRLGCNVAAAGCGVASAGPACYGTAANGIATAATGGLACERAAGGKPTANGVAAGLSTTARVAAGKATARPVGDAVAEAVRTVGLGSPERMGNGHVGRHAAGVRGGGGARGKQGEGAALPVLSRQGSTTEARACGEVKSAGSRRAGACVAAGHGGEGAASCARMLGGEEEEASFPLGHDDAHGAAEARPLSPEEVLAPGDASEGEWARAARLRRPTPIESWTPHAPGASHYNTAGGGEPQWPRRDPTAGSPPGREQPRGGRLPRGREPPKHSPRHSPQHSQQDSPGQSCHHSRHHHSRHHHSRHHHSPACLVPRSPELDEAPDELDTAMAELDSTKSELVSTQSGLDSVESELVSSISELGSTRSELVSTRFEVDAARALLEAVGLQELAARRQRDEAEVELAASSRDLVETRRDLEGTRRDLAASSRELALSRRDVEETRRDLDASSRELDLVSIQLRAARAQLAGVQQDLAQAQGAGELRAADAARAQAGGVLAQEISLERQAAGEEALVPRNNTAPASSRAVAGVPGRSLTQPHHTVPSPPVPPPPPPRQLGGGTSSPAHTRVPAAAPSRHGQAGGGWAPLLVNGVGGVWPPLVCSLSLPCPAPRRPLTALGCSEIQPTATPAPPSLARGPRGSEASGHCASPGRGSDGLGVGGGHLCGFAAGYGLGCGGGGCAGSSPACAGLAVDEEDAGAADVNQLLAACNAYVDHIVCDNQRMRNKLLSCKERLKGAGAPSSAM